MKALRHDRRAFSVSTERVMSLAENIHVCAVPQSSRWIGGLLRAHWSFRNLPALKFWKGPGFTLIVTGQALHVVRHVFLELFEGWVIRCS